MKRQAGKARKYKRLSDEIHALDALVAHLRWSEAKLACDIAREKLEESRRAVEDLTRRDAICERERIEASEGLGPLREAESVASAKLGQARIALARLETERKVAADAHARLEAEAARLVEDLEREQAAKAEAEAATENARNELSALPVMDEARNDEIEAEIRARLEAARNQLSAAEDAADNAQAELSEVRARRKASEENVGAQTRRRDQITADINRLSLSVD